MSFIRIKRESDLEDGYVEIDDALVDSPDGLALEIVEGGILEEDFGTQASPGSSPVELDQLPRPVQELNCKQARSYLVKLLRAANNGDNPSYGVPDKRPPFWPDFYWPWERLTDVHTKPKGMDEPLQYSEMMKLAISKGYMYYGYDPQTYYDAAVEERERERESAPPGTQRATSIQWQMDDMSVPPRLPRPASKLNCIQSRTSLSKLLRFQLCGNNPNYGSPATEPPWWPNDLIRWVDMVDLRGKPPYLPENSNYTEVLKIAIGRGLAHYGIDPENYTDTAESPPHMLVSPLAVPLHSSSPHAESSPPLPVFNAMVPPVVMGTGPCPNPVQRFSSQPSAAPPRLPTSISKMNCGEIRAALSRLLWFHNGTSPSYGNMACMPHWWPNNLMDWSKLKNLRHKYDGPLGDSYTNCLRIATIRGYNFFGLDAEEYVEANPNCNSVSEVLSAEQVAQSILQNICPVPPARSKRPMPALLPISPPSEPPKRLPKAAPKESINSIHSQKPKAGYSQLLLNIPDWYPPKVTCSKPNPPKSVLERLQPCKVMIDRTEIVRRPAKPSLPRMKPCQRRPLARLFQDDLIAMGHTDMKIYSKEGKAIALHTHVLVAHSENMKHIIRDIIPFERDIAISFPDIGYTTLEHLVRAMYYGKIVLPQAAKQDFLSHLPLFEQYGLLTSLGEMETTPVAVTGVKSNGVSPTGKRKATHGVDITPEVKRKKSNHPPLPEDLTWLDVEREIAYGKDSLIRFLIRERLLEEHLICSSATCDYDMELMEDPYVQDGHVWTCEQTGFDTNAHHAKNISVRRNSLLEPFQLTLEDLVRAIFCWQHSSSPDLASTKTGIAKHDLVHVFNMCNDNFSK